MQSDTQLMTTGYLRNVLLDGAKPFLYRSGVRSLLGIPDSGGSEIAFSHAMPTVGFAYPNSHFMGEPYLPPYFPDLAVGSALATQGIDIESNEEIVAKEAQQFQSESIAHSISQAKENPEPKVMPESMAQTSTATPESDQQNMVRPVPVSRQEKSLVEKSEMPEKPGTVFQPATIDIPGTSKKIQNFPVLSLSEHRESFSNMAEEQSQPLLSPSEALSSLPNIDESLLISPHPNLLSEDIGIYTTFRHHKKNVLQKSQPPSSAGEGCVDDNKIKGLQSIHPNLLSDEDGAPALKTTAFSTINAEPASERVTPIDPGMGNGASRSTDRIEQLRNAVHELAAKQSPPREQARYEAQPQQLPPPVQQVVIVRQPVSPATIPHAFWERSYLGRIRRILR